MSQTRRKLPHYAICNTIEYKMAKTTSRTYRNAEYEIVIKKKKMTHWKRPVNNININEAEFNEASGKRTVNIKTQ